MPRKLPTARQISHFSIVCILNSTQFIWSLFLHVVQMLNSVYYLSQLNSQVLLSNRYLIKLQDWGLIIDVDPPFMESHFS